MIKYESGMIIGRFQPFHLGHYSMLMDLYTMTRSKPTVCIVEGGSNSKLDINRNPFGISVRKKLILRCFPDVNIFVSSDAYIPRIYRDLQKKGINIDVLLAGEDRYCEYIRQLNRDGIPELEVVMENKYNSNGSEISSTRVRESIRNDRAIDYLMLMPFQLNCMYSKLLKLIRQADETGVQQEWNLEKT